MADEDKIVIYTDGSVFPNPGHGGWGCILIHPLGRKEMYGYGGDKVTNNQMELAAIENALKAVKNKKLPIELYTDSQWCLYCITGVFKNIKKNVDTIKRIQNYITEHELDIDWKFVRGHGKDKATLAEASDWNDKCHNLANEGREKKTSLTQYFKEEA